MPRKRPEKKQPVEQLQEQFLSGPADEEMDIVRTEMKENQVIVAKQVPDYEWVVFRNQRDPGYPLDFHYSSATSPFKQYTLIDGQKYHLPREIVRNLEGCRENIEKYRKNQSTGLPEIYVAGYKTHFVCERV